ncbi:MAG: carboxypeptidase-like regulatory domain-containing protein [Terriglobia bacterium]|jgi:tetratricopeptide (TPR) repeat protein
MRKASVRNHVLFVVAILFEASAFAQVIGPPSTPGRGMNLYTMWFIQGKVKTLQGDPVPNARVTVMAVDASAGPKSLMTDLQGEFRTEYSLNLESAKQLTLDLKVTKKGYLRAHALITFEEAGKTWVIPITLREAAENPQLLAQADLISGLAPRLSKLNASDGLSAEGGKDYARGVTEFIEKGSPDRAVPFFNKVIRQDASCLPCRTMVGLAELGSGDWDGAYRNLAEVFNKMMADRSLGRPEPFVALGVMESWEGKPRDAASYFLEALKYAPQDTLALQELGRSQLQVRNWGGADEYLGKALAAGAKPEIRLLRIEALLGEDQFQAADQEMARYLEGRDLKKMPLEARTLWVKIDNRKKIEADYGKGKSKGDQALDYLLRPPLDAKGLEPVADQAQLDPILSAVGKTVAESFVNFPNTSSLEQIHQEKLQGKQKSATTLDQKFRYLCFTPTQDWGPGFNEYRTDLSGRQTTPEGLADGFMLTSGFASAALVFHPLYQSQAEFRYVGRQNVNGRVAYLVAYAQRPAKAQFTGSFKSGDTTVTTFYQGLAWIDSETYQIIRLRSDLLRPVQSLNLQRETTEIAYGEVHFKDHPAAFWVPQQVTVSVDWNGKHLRNEHRYSEFKLFHVDATDKVGAPKEVERPSN